MNASFARKIGVVTLTFALAAGGCHTCRKPYHATCPQGCAPAACLPPAPQFIPGPAPIVSPPPVGIGAPPAPPEVRRYGPDASSPAYSWGPPSQGNVRLANPESASLAPQTEESPPASVRLQSPISDEVLKPSVTQERAPTPSLPVGIPQFTFVRERVTAGLKPSLEGLDWLKNNGYRAVLHIRQPGETNTSDQRVVEVRGLKYFNLEPTAENFARTAESFNRILGDSANYPLFVYDQDGQLAGALWYANYRTVERASEAEGLRKASSLGFKEIDSAEQRKLWGAIQLYLQQTIR